jgi:hypothetical protein
VQTASEGVYREQATLARVVLLEGVPDVREGHLLFVHLQKLFFVGARPDLVQIDGGILHFASASTSAHLRPSGHRRRWSVMVFAGASSSASARCAVVDVSGRLSKLLSGTGSYIIFEFVLDGAV